MAEPPEVHMWDRDVWEIEFPHDFRQVERASVVGDDELECEQEIREILQVFVFDEGMQFLSIEGYDCRDVVVKGFESTWFQIYEVFWFQLDVQYSSWF